MSLKAARGTLLTCLTNPWEKDQDNLAVRYLPDGILIHQEGRIIEVDEASVLLEKHPDLQVDDYSGHLILPGFIEPHVHYAQTKIVGSYGRELLDWLQTYTFPEELKFRSKDYADEIAHFFFEQILSHGTTTVQSFATTSPNSVHAFFQEAGRLDMRALCGLTGIDREGTAPDEYRDCPASFYEGSSVLIQEYHGKGRCHYSITPRFAYGSTHAQMAAAGQLAMEHPDCWVQTHLSENPREVEAVLGFFPDCQDYLGVYERYGLVRKRFCAGHSIYLSDHEFERLGKKGGSISFCPTSNLFLGSGLFAWDKANRHQVPWGVGCDSGGGNGLSLLRTLDDAYKVGMLGVVAQDPQRDLDALRLSPIRALYAITLGSAKALDLDSCVGSLEAGKDADFVVLDCAASALLDRRRDGRSLSDSLEEACRQFFGAMMLWVPEVVKATYISGTPRFKR